MFRFLGIIAACCLPLAAAWAKPPTELSVTADYCAIYYALTGSSGAGCEPPVVAAPTRSASAHAAWPPDDPGSARGYFIRFAFNSDNLTPAYRAHLGRLKDVLGSVENAALCLRLVGHTDTTGSVAYNQGLSERRAIAVKTYLVATLQVDGDRIETVGRGETSSLDGLPGQDARNRRVEILAKPAAGGCFSQ